MACDANELRHIPLFTLLDEEELAVLAARCLDLPPLPRGHSIALEYLGSRLGVPIHTPHNALGDAMTTAQVFLALASKLSRDRVLSANRLVSLSHTR